MNAPGVIENLTPRRDRPTRAASRRGGDRGARGRAEFPRRDGCDRAAAGGGGGPAGLAAARFRMCRRRFGRRRRRGRRFDRPARSRRDAGMPGFPRCRFSRADFSDSPPTVVRFRRRDSGRLCDGALRARDACPSQAWRARAHPFGRRRGRACRGQHRTGIGSGNSTQRQEVRRSGSICIDRGVEHVFDSRSLAFADDVLWKTGGRGVDVVLNSLSGPFLEKSLSVLAPSGRFLEIGKRDIYADTPLGLHAMRNNAAFHAIDLAKLAHGQPKLLRAEIEAVLGKLARGQLQLMPVTIFPASKVADAFRRMSEARHIGKVVVSFDDEEASVHEQSGARLPIASDATYLVTGGTSGFGLETARWLVDNGARSLALVGRSRTPTAETETALNDLRSAGATVTLVSADVGTRAGAIAALAAAERPGLPLRGIVHAAGTIDDALIANLGLDQIRSVFTGKVLGAWHLHELTQSRQLDFFVLYSSVAATLGTPGQAHYAAANRMLDAIAAYPPVARAAGRLDRVRSDRRPRVSDAPPGRVALHQWRRDATHAGCRCAGGARHGRCAMLRWTRHLRRSIGRSSRSRLRLLRPRREPRASSRRRRPVKAAPTGRSERSFSRHRKSNRPGIVAHYLHGKVAAVLKVEPTMVELDRPLHELGLDSLTAFELKNRIETELGVTLPVGQFLQRPTISAIVSACHSGDQQQGGRRCRNGRIRWPRAEHVDRPGGPLVHRSSRSWQSGLWACRVRVVPAPPQRRPYRSDHPKPRSRTTRICALPSRATGSVRFRHCCRPSITS